MFELLQMISILLTAFLSEVVFVIYKKHGTVKACVICIGFFVLGFYLDGLFALIMQGYSGGTSRTMMQILGILISKCIAVTALLGMRVLAKEETEKNGLWGVLEGNVRNPKEGMSQGSARTTWKYYEGLTLAISIFFLLLGALVQWQNSTGTVGMRMGAMLVLLLLLVTYYVSMYFHLRKQKVKASRSNEESLKHEVEVYLENVENNYQRTRELWHDLKNHINLMSLLLQDEKYGELKDYLRIFNEDVDSLTLPVKSGNLIVDALFADKLSKAKRERTEVSLDLCDMTGLKLQPDEICGLLGNLLDNALEANGRLREGRSLEVTCKELEECYYIRVRNPVGGGNDEDAAVGRIVSGMVKGTEANRNVEGKQGTLQTAKKDLRNKVGHGLGLRSAERIVHGCGGEMVVDSGEKYFTVVVRLPR